ncbi:MAG TPA: hypothetical protein DDW81_01475 [Cryomorphaceae bacterium]|nr:hypothetical protein [Owenweeksia sp.]HBF18733.1 hypothetical protein [Cryomorphaceae bacterium]
MVTPLLLRQAEAEKPSQLENRVGETNKIQCIMYSKPQIIHCLSLASNSALGLKFSSFSALQNYVQKVNTDVLGDLTCQSFIGSDWKPVWGPYVYSQDQTSSFAHADNVMSLLHSPSQNLLVIAIAGTNSVSMFGWMDEDFDVSTTKAWKDISGPSNSGAVSTGTYNGLDILLNKMPEPQTKGSSIVDALGNFLASNSDIQNAELSVAGHSLGGALSPVLALYLQNNQDQWNSKGQVTTISTYPTAGATPGTKDFADYYGNLIQDGKIDYHSEYNTFDVVPHGYQPDTIDKIPTLYSPENGGQIDSPSDANPQNPVIGMIATGLSLDAYKAGIQWGRIPGNPYRQVQPWTALANCAFNQDTDNEVQKKLAFVSPLILPPGLQDYSDTFKETVRYLYQALTQHTTEYNRLLDIEGFMNRYNTIRSNDKPSSSQEVDLAAEMVKRATGVDLTNLPQANEVKTV